jgi:tRNA pseudouridine32 synthase/23S rRNA pseudouridine746 synthase
MTAEGPHRLTRIVQIEHDPAGSICNFLAAETGLSKSKIKGAMQKGAVHLKRPGRSRKRIRRAKATLRRGDRIELYYDAAILATVPPPARCLEDRSHYSVWYKPAGLMTQGTLFGDHCALVRQVEKFFDLQRPVFPVHRLDREATGLLILAHSRDAAARLSALFRQRDIEKVYRTTVRGKVGPPASTGRIDHPLDGKPAVTSYTVLSFNPDQNTSGLEIRTGSGRKHQIRRHLASSGHPVMGDPAYGSDNKTAAGLHLCATRLAFTCPYHHKRLTFDLNRLLPDHHCVVCF